MPKIAIQRLLESILEVPGAPQDPKWSPNWYSLRFSDASLFVVVQEMTKILKKAMFENSGKFREFSGRFPEDFWEISGKFWGIPGNLEETRLTKEFPF